VKPIYCAETGSLNPNDIPMTAKKVPAGVPEIRSTITRRPEIAHALMKPARCSTVLIVFEGFSYLP
jgi:hypothetical protein